jgi:CRISPR-associated protein Csb2
MNIIARNYKPSGAERKAGKFQGDPTIVFDTFVSVRRGDPLYIGWPNAQLSDLDQAALGQLLANLSSLGRAEGWTHATLSNDQPVWNCGPAAESDSNSVAVLCPDPATAFDDEHYPTLDRQKLSRGKVNPADFLFDCPRWHLCLDTEIIHRERWPTVPGATWVNYTRPLETIRTSVDRRPMHRQQPTVARFLLDGPVLPLITDTVRVAEAIRHMILCQYQRYHQRKYGNAQRQDVDKFRSEVLSGKDGAGQYLPGHGHAYYLPTAEGDDCLRITHVTVWARRGFDSGETAALTALRSFSVSGLELRTQLVGLGRPEEFRFPLFGGPAGKERVWASATPYIGPSHVGGGGRERYLRKAIRREVRRWLMECGGGEAEVEAMSESEVAWKGRPRPFEFVRSRSRDGATGLHRPFGLFRITLASPLPGPLCLGYAAHYGLGLFLPVGAADDCER